MISAEELLKPISDAQPCGEDLYSSTALQELEDLMSGTPERQFGDKVYPAEDPDWNAVLKRCLELFARSKDLRVATPLCVAAAKTGGWPALNEAVKALDGLVERYWEAVYPRLDPEDHNDPLQRVNIIAGLATPAGTYGDPVRFLERVRSVPLTNSRQMGRFTLTDLRMSQGRISAPDGKPGPTTAQIDAAFRDTSAGDLAAIHAAAGEASMTLKRMEEFLAKTIGSGSAPSLDALRAELQEVQKSVAPYVSGVAAATAEQGGEASPNGAPTGSTPRSAPGEIASRQDVVEAIDRICQYYDRHEPSSPVPHLLKRAKRLAGMSFMEITQDLSPEALAQVRVIFGEKDENAAG